MTTVYSYCVRYDRGTSPNPFWGVCTLVICKPKIRQKAQPGDWIVGFGSKNSPSGDLSARLVYMMRVTEKMTMEEYDPYTRQHLPGKIPDMSSSDPRLLRGDSVYDFSTGKPVLRDSVHTEEHRRSDLSGGYALLSTNFRYFGRNAIEVPDTIKNLIRMGQGHRSRSNDPWIYAFQNWVSNFPLPPNFIYGLPHGSMYDECLPFLAKNEAIQIEWSNAQLGSSHEKDRIA